MQLLLVVTQLRDMLTAGQSPEVPKKHKERPLMMAHQLLQSDRRALNAM
ncbi:hypothetical protein [Armatimonas sp.]